MFRVLDWMLALPPELNESFRNVIYRFEEERKMPYVTSIERLATEKGRAEGREEGRQQGREEGCSEGIEGLQKGILELLKFPGAGAKLTRKVRAERDIERLQAFLVAVGRAQTLDEVRAQLP